jgi:hypothetical protein
MPDREQRGIAALAVIVVVSAYLALSSGCRGGRPANSGADEPPTLRIQVVSTLAGALEPCGCVKDMLGGVDHAAALLAKASERVPALLFAAGPTLFQDPGVEPDARAQRRWKAEALAESFRDMQLRAWTPGVNDWALGPDELGRLSQMTGAALLASNLTGSTGGAKSSAVVEIAGVRVGVTGVSVPERAGRPPAGVVVGDPQAALGKARAELEAQGARLLIALLAIDRGSALRLAESVPGFHLFIVGKPFDEGEGNDPPTPPVLIGSTLVVQAPNHLQALATVDVYVRTPGKIELSDASGIEQAEKRRRLEQRIRDLEQRIASAEKAGAGRADIESRRADLDRLRRELDDTSRTPPAAPEGSYFRYALNEVRERLGSEPHVSARLDRYYRRVNDHNRTALADRKPPPVPEGRSGYIGVQACSNCHVEEEKVWLATGHAGAYATLDRQHKQFNLECVSCHVTGYGEPGGSTVTHVASLESVQCEVCHGAGSRHVDDPKNKSLITRTPPVSLCAAECHHPPHVKSDWDVRVAWPKILGKGHGR